MNRRWLWNSARLVFGVGLLILTFRQVDWSQIGPALAGVNLGWLLVVWLVVLAGHALRIWRWWVLLINNGLTVRGRLVSGAYLIGQSANILLPVRGGELLRFGWLRARHPQGSAQILASIAIEKYLDLVMLLLFCVAALPYLPVHVIEANLPVMLASSLGLTILILAGVFSGPRLAKGLASLIERLFQPGSAMQRRLGWAVPAIQPVVGWLSSSVWLQSPLRFLSALALSLGSWLLMALTNLVMMQAVGLAWDWRAALLVQVLIIIGSLPALVPGNIGPFHFFAMLGLSLMGISGAKSAAFALLLHAVVTLTPLLGSGCLLLVDRRQQDWKLLGKVQRHEQTGE